MRQQTDDGGERGVRRTEGRGLHAFTIVLNFSTSPGHIHELGCTVDRRAQVELKWERV